MKISDTGIKLITSSEGCRLKAYQDSVGVWTIGYGHTKGVHKGQVITQTEAENFLREDLAGAEKSVMKYDKKYHWNQNQFDALVSFAFNIGSIDQLTNNGKRTIAEISSKIPEYKKAKGVVLPGLVKRRAREKQLFDSPCSPNSGYIAEGSQSSAQEAPTPAKVLQQAQSFAPSKRGDYRVTTSLHLRYGPQADKYASMVVMPADTKASCEGYYTMTGETPWLLVEATVKGKKYKGFASGNYLSR